MNVKLSEHVMMSNTGGLIAEAAQEQKQTVVLGHSSFQWSCWCLSLSWNCRNCLRRGKTAGRMSEIWKIANCVPELCDLWGKSSNGLRGVLMY